MSETYQSKRERRQRMLEALHAELREHVSLRNVEAVAALAPQAQTRLLEAIQAGLTRLPRAIEQLRKDPQTSVADLLTPPSQIEVAPAIKPVQIAIAQTVADQIQECFPDMPRVSAEALAEAEVMQVVRSVAETHQQVFKSGHIKTDFVMLTLYGLMRQTLEQLEEIIEESPALRQAFEQTNEWRKEETC
ncbi:MAG: hypothetical protein KJZ72_03645 [Anaerolineales bacterium]|jgi:hypothetical protein|nr:hypothetical protein [Anaerolineales bacterium]